MSEYAASQYYGNVVDIIAEVIMIETDEIQPESKIIDELGAESIDFLEIINRIEEMASITLPDANILKYLSDKYGKETFFDEGKLNETGVQVLRLAMPEVDSSKITIELREHEIAELLTPLTFVRMIEVYKDLEKWKPEKCDKCDSIEFNKEDKDKDEYLEISLDPGPLYKCIKCGNLMSSQRVEDQIYEQAKLNMDKN